MRTLGLLGAGCIGYRIARGVANGELPYELAAVCDRSDESVARVQQLLPGATRAGDFGELAAACDVLVECAAAEAVAALVQAARESHARGGKPEHVVVLSVGGLLDVPRSDSGPVVHIPSGAIAGLDAVQALAVAGLDEVTLTSRKPPAGLGQEITSETILFEGSARDVIAKYPRNVNVAVALSFAGIGPDRTMVRLIADPAVDRNSHHLRASGPAGEVECTSRNVPFPDNPATSYLAALSAVALLKKLADKLQVG